MTTFGVAILGHLGPTLAPKTPSKSLLCGSSGTLLGPNGDNFGAPWPPKRGSEGYAFLRTLRCPFLGCLGVPFWGQLVPFWGLWGCLGVQNASLVPFRGPWGPLCAPWGTPRVPKSAKRKTYDDLRIVIGLSRVNFAPLWGHKLAQNLSSWVPC